MANLKASKFAEKYGIKPLNNVYTYAKRGKIIIKDGMVNEKDPINAEFISKKKALIEVKVEKRVSEKKDTKIIIPEIIQPDTEQYTDGLNDRQRAFCHQYVWDFNATRSYKEAYKSKNSASARTEGCKLLMKPNVKAYIDHLKNNLAEVAGISPLMVLNEHKKLAFSSIAHLHNTWITRKEFEELTEDQKSCISEIATSVKTQILDKKKVDVEYIKIKLYDKQKSLDAISKMLGYNEPEKIDLSNKGEKFESIDYSKLDESTLRAIIEATKP